MGASVLAWSTGRTGLMAVEEAKATRTRRGCDLTGRRRLNSDKRRVSRAQAIGIWLWTSCQSCESANDSKLQSRDPPNCVFLMLFVCSSEADMSR